MARLTVLLFVLCACDPEPMADDVPSAADAPRSDAGAIDAPLLDGAPVVDAPTMDGGLRTRPVHLVGALRVVNGGFADDAGPVLPIFVHFGEAFSRYVRDPDAVRRQLDVVSEAGYHGIRFWATLGGSYWAGREVSEAVTPDYWGQLRRFLLELSTRDLRAVISQGDLARITDRIGYANRLSDVLDTLEVGATVAIIEGGNEAWQTGEPDPVQLARFVAAIEARHPNVLYTLSSPPGETRDELNAWSIPPADLYDVHGSRAGHWWDKVRHIFNVAYESAPMLRLGWQGEPTGPGSAVSVTENQDELNDDTLAAMAAMSLLARQAWCYMSGPGVLFDSPIDAQPGFWTVPRVRDALPADVMTYETLFHGGDAFAAQRVIRPLGETRCEHALDDDGRFAIICYGPSLGYEMARLATIERMTDIGANTRVFVGRLP